MFFKGPPTLQYAGSTVYINVQNLVLLRIIKLIDVYDFIHGKSTTRQFLIYIYFYHYTNLFYFNGQ